MEIEVAERTSRRIQRHRDQSEAPAGKTFASFDFDAAPGVRKQQLLSLGAGGDWIKNGEKRHRQKSRYRGHLPCSYRCWKAGLVHAYHRHRSKAADCASRPFLIGALEKLDKFDLIVLDDLSYVRKDQAETSVLFELIAHRYERHSIAITANHAFSAWSTVFPDAAMTAAAVDRLVHHATIIEMNGESYRERSAARRATNEETPILA